MDTKIISVTLLVLAVTTALPASLCGQQEALAFSESVEEIMALTDDADPTMMLEELAQLRESPVVLNNADIKELSRIFFLTEFQIMVLAEYVRENGNVMTLYELALLPAFDRSTVMMMAPYVTLDPVPPGHGRHYGRTGITITAIRRITDGETPEGIRSLLRIRHESNLFDAGLTAENDPGERFSFRETPGADFLSGYLELKGKGVLERVIIGDYALRAGEGVLLNSSHWMGSWLSSPSFISGRSTVLPYRSTEENNFFRGISLMLGNINAGAILFASSHSLDARILYDDEGIACGVKNLVTGGLHVTPSQLEARNSLRETVTGARLSAGSAKIRGGITSMLTLFSLPFVPDLTKAENIFQFEGSRLLNLAADMRAGTGPLLFFCEAGVSHPGSWAALAGVRARPSARVTCNLLARHFAPSYHAFHAGAFKTVSGSGNESGLALSLHLEVAGHLFITAAADHYLVPWARYRSSSPSGGSRIEVRGEYLPSDDCSLRAAYTFSTREYDVAAVTGPATAERRSREQLTVTFNLRPVTGVQLTTRAAFSSLTPASERGYLLCQDLSFALRRLPVRFWLRHASGTTAGWDSRLYAWESDLLSSFSVPAFYGKMSRSFIMLSWKPGKMTELRVKYAFAGSGDYENNSLKQEMKGQLKIIF